MVTSTRDNCLGQDCPQHKECFVLAARREALAADLVVVNHHLFFADVMLRDEGTAELLPACNTVIFDEAHQLPEVASLFFGDSVSTAQLLELTRYADRRLASARDCLDLPKLCATLEKAARDLRLTLPVEPARYALQQLEARPGSPSGVSERARCELEALAAACWKRRRSAPRASKAAGGAPATCCCACNRNGRTAPMPISCAGGRRIPTALQLNATPLVIAEIMQKQMSGHPRAWIFTSATLAVQDDFGHYCTEMGLVRRQLGALGESLRLPNQALLYAPQSARSEQQPTCRSGRQGCFSGAQGERWPRVLSLYLAARDAPNA
jgi:ATP-dependent DNA helicase DinG